MKRTPIKRATPLRRTSLGARPEPFARSGRLNPRTPKRAKQEREYGRLRLEFLAANPWCTADIPGCTGRATQVHHAAGRSGERLTDVGGFVAICAQCHQHLTEHPTQAYLLGLSERRHGGAA